MVGGCEARSSRSEEVDFATTLEWVGDRETLSSPVLERTGSTVIRTEVGGELRVYSVDDCVSFVYERIASRYC